MASEQIPLNAVDFHPNVSLNISIPFSIDSIQLYGFNVGVELKNWRLR
jgi:hypothetical protein